MLAVSASYWYCFIKVGRDFEFPLCLDNHASRYYVYFQFLLNWSTF